jgi:two-component system chemotaxis response regulator CheB
MIRVLIVDDSPTLRHLIRAILNSDSELRVVGEARNGQEAIALCKQLQPDIITMDIQMPGMDGYQAIRHIMVESPRPIVVLTSTMSDEALQVTYKGIEAGALMVIGKPHDLPGIDPEADKLIATIKAMADVIVVRRRRRSLTEPAPPSASQPDRRVEPIELTGAAGDPPVHLIAIGTSTGGPPALQAILSHLPTGLPVPVVVVQHISTGFVQGLARWLNESVPLRVKVIEPSETLRPGTVYLAADGKHLLVAKNNQAWQKDSPPVDGHRPSVTALFETVARDYGPLAVGVLLTGMGSDGARGLKAIYEAGGYTIVQDEASCVVFGMPKVAIALGAASEVLALEKIGPRLVRLVEIRKESAAGAGKVPSLANDIT